MTIIIDNRQKYMNITDEIENTIHSVVRKTLEMENMDERVEISVVLVDNEQIRELNREFRKIDRETDVLSFPMLEYEGYDEDGEESFTPEDFLEETDPDTQEILLGDIVISLEKAEEQARDYGHSLMREIGFLTVHGLLHLLGYDHENGEEESIMQRKQEEVLEGLNLRRGKV